MRAEGPGAGAIVPVLILAAGFIGVLVLMRWAWQRHSQRDRDVPAAPSRLEEPVSLPLLGPCTGVYVCSTRAGDPLGRIHAHTLGNRSRAIVSVYEPKGLVIDRPAERTIAIEPAAIVGVRLESGMAGKFLGGDGLVVVTWTLGDQLVDTGIKLDSPEQHRMLVSALSTCPEEAQ